MYIYKCTHTHTTHVHIFRLIESFSELHYFSVLQYIIVYSKNVLDAFRSDRDSTKYTIITYMYKNISECGCRRRATTTHKKICYVIYDAHTHVFSYVLELTRDMCRQKSLMINLCFFETKMMNSTGLEAPPAALL